MDNEKGVESYDPPVNVAEALNRAMGDTELIQMLFEELKTTIGTHVEKIEAALNSDDMEGMTKEAHQLKGAAGSMSVPGVADKARNLEMMGRGEMALDSHAILELQSEVKKFVDYMDCFDWQQV